MVYSPPEPPLWNDNEPHPTVLTAYEELIEKILSYRKKYTPDEPGIIPLTKEAKQMIYQFQNHQAYKSLGISDGNARYVLNKAGMHAARLCFVLHIVKCAETDLHPLSSVSEETMRQALILTEWFLNEAERVYAMLRSREGTSQEDRDAVFILTKIQQLGGEATVSLLKDRIAKYHCKGGSEALERKLREMVKYGMLKVHHKIAGNNRAVEYFHISAIPTIPIPAVFPGKNGHSGNM
jgi:hypothetical protein